jgi:hypothetical protein
MFRPENLFGIFSSWGFDGYRLEYLISASWMGSDEGNMALGMVVLYTASAWSKSLL